MKDNKGHEPSDYTTSVSNSITSEGLEALKNIKREAGFPYFSTFYDADMWREDFATVEKELKALEIIKDKDVSVYLLKECLNLMSYNNAVEFPYRRLTPKEYELLKECCYVEKLH